MTRHKIPVVLMACTSLPSSAQGTADDYNRAYSERDNYNHLYMYDRATGKPTRQITKGR